MKAYLVLVGACLFGMTASAAEVKKTYGGIEIATVRIANEAQEIANEYVAALGGSVTVTQDLSASAGRLFLGYRLDEKWAIEGGFFTTGKFDARATGRSSGGVSYTANTKVDVQGVDFSAVWTPMASRIGEDGFFLKAGLHSSKVSSSSSYTVGTTRGSISGDDSGIGSLLGLGYDWKLGTDVFVRSSITRYLNLGGDSSNKSTVYSIGIGTAF